MVRPPQKRRTTRAAYQSKLKPGARGKRKSGDVAGGRIRDVVGPPALVKALIAALRARGEITRVTHRFHTYPARMHPDAARLLLAALPGESLLDPFCGGGTVLVEAMLAGRRAIGRDINPVAALVARTRTRLCSKSELETLHMLAGKLGRQAEELAMRAQPPDPIQPLAIWYGKRALGELSALWWLIEDTREPQRSLLRAMLSTLVVKYSQRASDTSARRIAEEPRRGAVLKAFAARADELVRMLGELRSKVPRGVEPADVAIGDARALDAKGHLICSSPPYPGTYDYLPMQHLRLAWMGHGDALKEAGEREIGARRWFRASVDDGYLRWQDETRRWLMSAAGVLEPEGHIVVMLGDGIAGARLLEARDATIVAARDAALSLHAAVSIERVDPATQLAKREHAIVLTRLRREPLAESG